MFKIQYLNTQSSFWATREASFRAIFKCPCQAEREGKGSVQKGIWHFSWLQYDTWKVILPWPVPVTMNLPNDLGSGLTPWHPGQHTSSCLHILLTSGAYFSKGGTIIFVPFLAFGRISLNSSELQMRFSWVKKNSTNETMFLPLQLFQVFFNRPSVQDFPDTLSVVHHLLTFD